jgi:hypothetical protein
VVVALSTKEGEYMVATHGSKEAVQLKRLCLGIRFKQRDMKIICNSQSEIFMVNNPTYHSKMKHINVQYYFMRDVVERKKMPLEKVDMLENITNSLTNFVSVVKFSWCREEMGIVSLD